MIFYQIFAGLFVAFVIGIYLKANFALWKSNNDAREQMWNDVLSDPDMRLSAQLYVAEQTAKAYGEGNWKEHRAWGKQLDKLIELERKIDCVVE